ncbi:MULTISPECIES: AAA family ATPase [Paraburkholderia]|uniref:AAA family ATPase n=1 Tax=Paraburkholderia TaxID=1822464 RepID=UPI00225BF0B1|nr:MULTISPECIES: AAA family ATPase [Paraburkholderia]MCX4173123.1 AAA family ATPase [Paraburkholderia madseniana]MDQ6461130.1 AAA family ATPase [Paraburkholderia madseniana]
MNVPELTEDENLGLYQRATENGAEWWRVSVADRPENYRLEHGVDGGNGTGSVDIDLVVDAENLRAKLKKWRREGFAIDTPDAADEAGAAERVAFMPELQRVAALASAAKRHLQIEDAGETVRIGRVDVPCGVDNPLVPRINPAYLFSERFNDIVEDIVENRRVMLIGHTGAGKTSLIEQVAARSHHGVLRSNMNGQTTVGDFVGFWTVKGGETIWVDGVLPTAMREGLWLIVDEIDFAEPSILAALTAVLEPHGRLVLKEKGNEIVAPHPAFRLFATANAVGAMSQFRHLYQGANLMNEAFLDRWRVYMLDYLTPAEEADVLMRTLAPHMTRALAATLAAIAADCRAAFAREDLSSAFSTRRLLDWAELMLRTGEPERAAGPAIYAKVSPEDAALIRGIVRHHIAPAA